MLHLVTHYLTVDEWVFLGAQLLSVYGVGLLPRVADWVAVRVSR